MAKEESKKYTNVNKRWTQFRVRGTGACNYAYSTDGRVTAVDEAACTLNSPQFIDAYGRRCAFKISGTAPCDITSLEVWAVLRGPDID